MTIVRRIQALLGVAVLCGAALPAHAQDAAIAPTPAASPGQTLNLPAAGQQVTEDFPILSRQRPDGYPGQEQSLDAEIELPLRPASLRGACP